MDHDLVILAIRAVFILTAAYVIVTTATGLVRKFLPRDPRRIFTADQKRHLMRRAGSRCEHHYVGLLRCRRTHRLQADHVMPWSRGGRTTIQNGQMLCGIHNRRKTNRVPSHLYRWALRHRQARYFVFNEVPGERVEMRGYSRRSALRLMGTVRRTRNPTMKRDIRIRRYSDS